MDFEALPELKKSKNPRENKNPDFMAQALLIARSPFREDEWVGRFAAAFRELFNKDEAFRELTNDLSEKNLRTLQEMLDHYTAERH